MRRGIRKYNPRLPLPPTGLVLIGDEEVVAVGNPVTGEPRCRGVGQHVGPKIPRTIFAVRVRCVDVVRMDVGVMHVSETAAVERTTRNADDGPHRYARIIRLAVESIVWQREGVIPIIEDVEVGQVALTRVTAVTPTDIHLRGVLERIVDYHPVPVRHGEIAGEVSRCVKLAVLKDGPRRCTKRRSIVDGNDGAGLIDSARAGNEVPLAIDVPSM